MNDAEYVRLRNEHHMTLRVLAVVVEKLQSLTDSELIEIPDELVLHSPDLTALRDEEKCLIGLRTQR